MKQTSNTGAQIHFLQQNLFCEGKTQGTLMKKFKNDISKSDARFKSSVHLWTQQNAKSAHFYFQQSGSATSL